MAADTPVLERPIAETKSEFRCAVPSRMEFLAEDQHNARIRETYARLINPESKIEDVFSGNRVMPRAETLEEQAPTYEARPYFVENARADAAIFRADSAINQRKEESVQSVEQCSAEEEDEDLRPTATTIQYQTIGKKKTAESATGSKLHLFGKNEKLFLIVFIAVVVALVTLVIINSTVIANLNADIATVQDSITTVKGAIAGVSSTVEEIINGALNH